MTNESQLITVPTFTFNQGDMFEDGEFERPVSVDFYNGCICLRQDGDYPIQETIKIHPAFFEKLVKAIRRHKVEADKSLEMKAR